MDILRVRQLVKHAHDRVILLENGEPEMVLLSFKEYERIMQQIMHQREQGILIELPQDMKDAKSSQQKSQFSEVSLEDLPIEGY
ncbi:MAG: hypothetical protein G01um101466_175 [Parcubacteria group bacterium Gr01-1014_66]|nr:MAG: hypothetical protein G01um101466_175 [Parcubacteria group bacterium Gr01-1014_66]